MNFWDFWWIIPLVMVVLCVLMMGGRMRSMMCGHGPHEKEGHGAGGEESAGDILDKRFARGEISTEEYEEMKKALTGKEGSS